MRGTVFDIKEFAIHDGGGIRTTVFLKGCPLRCAWCHNPEGLSRLAELFVKHKRCRECGLCRKGCSHPECQAFGRCLHICPEDALSVAGREYEAAELAEKLLRDRALFESTGGGVTLSGGEPLMQSEFCTELISELGGKVHIAIETSGFATEEVFCRVASACDFVFMDIKLMDSELHKKYTGVDNAAILKNAEILKSSGIPHRFRTPLIPGITDTAENLRAIEKFTAGSPWEKLPYNALAPAKYANVGRIYPLDIKVD